MSDNSSNAILGILAGTAIGAALGILFAPDKGSNTRKKLVEETNNVAGNVADRATDLKDQLVSTVTSQKESLSERVDSLVSDASYKTEDLITTLEDRLKALKAKNKKLQQNKTKATAS